MPAQALITHLSKADVQKTIGELKATAHLEIVDGPDADTFVLRCKSNKPAATEALQKIADSDSLSVRAAENSDNSDGDKAAPEKE